MSQNPFGGEGGFDLGAMLEQAQQMQEQLMAAQSELAAATVEGSAGGVTLTVNGTGELLSATIAPGSFDGNDEESLADLGDLVVAAYRDAKSRADSMAQEKLGPLTNALGDAAPGGPPDPSLGGPVV